jgi:hypothetical protein
VADLEALIQSSTGTVPATAVLAAIEQASSLLPAGSKLLTTFEGLAARLLREARDASPNRGSGKSPPGCVETPTSSGAGSTRETRSSRRSTRAACRAPDTPKSNRDES